MSEDALCDTVKIEAGQHFRHGKIEVRHRIWKGMSRAMLDRAGMLITNLVLLEAVEEGSAKATGKEERTTVWEAHFGVKPLLDQYLLGPFGCLAFLLLSECLDLCIRSRLSSPSTI